MRSGSRVIKLSEDIKTRVIVFRLTGGEQEALITNLMRGRGGRTGCLLPVVMYFFLVLPGAFAEGPVFSGLLDSRGSFSARAGSRAGDGSDFSCGIEEYANLAGTDQNQG
jgi:hypothetical protein